MKYVLLIVLAFGVSSKSFGSEKDSKRIKYAISLLDQVANKSIYFKVKPGNVKEVLLQIAMKERDVESPEEFENSWVGNKDSKWGADSMEWGSETNSGAFSYVRDTLESEFESGDQAVDEKVKLVDDTQKAKKAFAILRSIPTVQYGVAPMGAVQCGVTFAALVIVDTETGEAYIISVESSGC